MLALNLIVMIANVLTSAGYVQYPAANRSPQYRVEFEDDQIRVLRVSLRAGEATPVNDHPDAVLIYLTADLDGRAPAAEAAWRPMGTYAIENRARTNFEAILVELKAPVSGVPGSIAPEAMPVAYSSESLVYPYYDGQPHKVNSLFENTRVAVTWHRLVPLTLTEADHFHPTETMFVYLTGGEMSGSTGQWGVRRARRGEFDLMPAYVFHALRNVGNDPIEFVMITPK